MDLNNLYSILRDLRKYDTLVTESTNNLGYSINIKTITNNMEEKIVKAGINEVPKLKKGLKEIQSKCEKDNYFSKKTITVTRPDLVLSLFKAHDTCSDKLVTYFRSSFSSGEKLMDAKESVEKTINKVNELVDEVFSFKDDFEMHTVTARFIDLIKDMDEVGDYFEVMDDILNSVKENENEIQSSEENSKEINITRNKLRDSGNMLSSYTNLTFRIYNKAYEMIDHHVKTYSE